MRHQGRADFYGWPKRWTYRRGELALFDLLAKSDISKVDRERVKQSSRSLLAAIEAHLKNFDDWTDLKSSLKRWPRKTASDLNSLTGVWP